MFVHLDLVDGCDNLRAVGRQEHVNWNHEYECDFHEDEQALNRHNDEVPHCVPQSEPAPPNLAGRRWKVCQHIFLDVRHVGARHDRRAG
jgi:hypothetical protein